MGLAPESLPTRRGKSVVIGAWKSIFPSFQAYMENSNTAHNHLCKSCYFPHVQPGCTCSLKNIYILLCANCLWHRPGSTSICLLLPSHEQAFSVPLRREARSVTLRNNFFFSPPSSVLSQQWSSLTEKDQEMRCRVWSSRNAKKQNILKTKTTTTRKQIPLVS